MKTPHGLPLFLVAAGFALLAAISYDASLLARFAGVPVEGGEAALVAVALPAALLLMVFGVRGLRRKPVRA